MKNKINNHDLLSKCSVCDGNLDAGKMVILENSERKSTFHTTCSRCNTSAIVFVSSNQSGLVSMGLITDLDNVEIKKVFRSEVVTVDNVMDVHEAVMGFVGGTTELAKFF